MHKVLLWTLAGAICAVAATAAQAGGWHTYRDAKTGWSISYPDGWRVNPAYVYTALGPGKEIHGVSFTVPDSFTTGTNLADDSYFAVETLPSAKPCNANAFLDDAIDKPRLKSGKNGMTWQVLDGVDQGAGNIREETVQALIGARPCIATRALAHSANIDNFDPGTVKPFDRRAFNSIMDKMRASFRLVH